MKEYYPAVPAGSTWEIDWDHPDNTGTKVMARNPTCHLPKVREWHMTGTATLRRAGINTPTYRKDSWEIDWSKRDGKKVWARNVHSKMPAAREWHWIDQSTLNVAGIKWRPSRTKRGRFLNGDGYVVLTRSGMTEEEIALVEKHDFFAKSTQTVLEHRLVALREFGSLPKGFVVRHLNGIKTDNRPENLVWGTHRENCLDHETARIEAMYWRNKYEAAVEELARLERGRR